MNRPRITLGAALAAMLSLAASNALAHAELESSSPPAGAVLKGSPKEIRLSFDTNLDGRSSRATLQSQSGGPIIGGSALDAKDRGTLVLPLRRPLLAGRYIVRWVAVTHSDGHRTEGSYPFSIRR